MLTHGYFLRYFHLDHRTDDVAEVHGEAPVGEMAFQFAQVTDVADVIADAIGIAERMADAIRTEFFDQRDALEHAGRVIATATEIVDLTGRGFLAKASKARITSVLSI